MQEQAIFGGAKDILPEFSQICLKNFYATNFLPTNSVAVGRLYFLYQVAIDLKIEYLVLEICF